VKHETVDAYSASGKMKSSSGAQRDDVGRAVGERDKSENESPFLFSCRWLVAIANDTEMRENATPKRGRSARVFISGSVHVLGTKEVNLHRIKLDRTKSVGYGR
jgi:hypothetical protein